MSSAGVHTVQAMGGCEVNDDGTTRGYEQLITKNKLEATGEAIDWLTKYVSSGRDTLERKGVHAVQAMDGCEVNDDGTTRGYEQLIIKNKLEATGEAIDWLTKFVSSRRDTLERKDKETRGSR